MSSKLFARKIIYFPVQYEALDLLLSSQCGPSGDKMCLFGPTLSPSGSRSVPTLPPGTCVFDSDLWAVLTVHLTAPVELAVAAAHHLHAFLLHSQTAVVAQPAAAPSFPLAQAICVWLQTLPALGAVEPEADVPFAVVGRVLQVDELGLGDAVECVRDGSPAICAVSSPLALSVDVQFSGVVVFDF